MYKYQNQFGNIFAEKIIAKPITANENNELNILLHFPPSLRSAESDLTISKSSIQKVLEKYGMHAYKRISVQALQPEDALARIHFRETILRKTQEDQTF